MKFKILLLRIDTSLADRTTFGIFFRQEKEMIFTALHLSFCQTYSFNFRIDWWSDYSSWETCLVIPSNWFYFYNIAASMVVEGARSLAGSDCMEG